MLGCKTPSLLQNWGLQGVCKDSTSGVKWTPVAIVANTPTFLLPLCHCSCCNVILFMRIKHTPAYTYKHSVKFKNFDWTDSRLFYKRAVTSLKKKCIVIHKTSNAKSVDLKKEQLLHKIWGNEMLTTQRLSRLYGRYTGLKESTFFWSRIFSSRRFLPLTFWVTTV